MYQMAFGLWAGMGPRNHVLDEVQILMGRRNFRGEGWPVALKYSDIHNSPVSGAKMDEPINMPFGIWTQVGPRRHTLDKGSDPHVNGQLLRERACLSLSCQEFPLQSVLDIHATNKTLWYNCADMPVQYNYTPCLHTYTIMLWARVG